jgi:hypothetical protein
MSTISIINGDGVEVFIEVDGSGTLGDPYRLKSTNSAAGYAALQAIQAATEALGTKVGEVQVSPTVNTLLDRLKQIYTAITGTLTVATHAVSQSGIWNIGTVTTVTGVTNVVHVDDNSSSLTVDGTVSTTAADGSNATIGTTTDAAASGNGTVVGILKQLRVLLSAALSVAQSGIWTVQPGNTANTTAWKVDGSAVTQPVSHASLAPSSATPVCGTLALSTSAAAIGSSQVCQDLLVQSDPNNTDDVLVGGSASQTIRLVPGGAWPFQQANVNLIYAKSVAGTPTLNWSARI